MKTVQKRAMSVFLAFMMCVMQLMILPVSNNVSADDTGTLKVSNYKIEYDNDSDEIISVDNGKKLEQGQTLYLSFDWLINNNEDITTYTTNYGEFFTENITISAENAMGELYDPTDGIHIGTYTIDTENKTLTIALQQVLTKQQRILIPEQTKQQRTTPIPAQMKQLLQKTPQHPVLQRHLQPPRHQPQLLVQPQPLRKNRLQLQVLQVRVILMLPKQVRICLPQLLLHSLAL